MLDSTSNLSGNGLPSQKISTRLAESDMEVDQDGDNPLNVLISAAKTANPMQYQLPSELSCTVQLPGNLSYLLAFKFCIIFMTLKFISGIVKKHAF